VLTAPGFEDISEILNLPLYPGFEPGSKVDTNFSEMLLHLCIPVSWWVVEPPPKNLEV
jgi:hypothetical protein